MSDYYFIVSKLNGYVLDVEGANPAAGAPLIAYPQKSSGTDNQLWLRVPTGPGSGSSGQSQYYLKSKLNGYVATISGANPAPATPIINSPKLSPAANNQIWQFIDSDIDGYFFIVSQFNNNVLDIYGNNTAAGTQVISYPQKPGNSPNQLWTFVDSNQPGPKKSAFA